MMRAIWIGLCAALGLMCLIAFAAAGALVIVYLLSLLTL